MVEIIENKSNQFRFNEVAGMLVVKVLFVAPSKIFFKDFE